MNNKHNPRSNQSTGQSSTAQRRKRVVLRPAHPGYWDWQAASKQINTKK